MFFWKKNDRDVSPDKKNWGRGAEMKISQKIQFLPAEIPLVVIELMKKVDNSSHQELNWRPCTADFRELPLDNTW